MEDERRTGLGRGGGLYLKPRNDSCTKGARFSHKALGRMCPGIEANRGGLDALHTMSTLHERPMARIESKDREAGTGLDGGET
jgi:hypothetical protein